MADIRLIVQADDLGMCRSVNEGIGLARTDGILTQTSAMAPTPWFAEGAALAKRIGIPTGLHVTFTCDWEYLRWGPLTPAPSMRDEVGLFKNSVAGAAQSDVDEAIAEAHAQADRAIGAGLELIYVDPHMGLSVIPAYEAVCARLGLKFMYPGVNPHYTFDSVTVTAMWSRKERGAILAEFLEKLEPGTHMLQLHPSIASPEMRAVTPEDAENAFWAESTRVPDLEMCCSPDVRKVVESRGIELISVADL